MNKRQAKKKRTQEFRFWGFKSHSESRKWARWAHELMVKGKREKQRIADIMEAAFREE